jgi:hypothetical protein
MPKSATRRRKQPQARTTRPAAREARPPLPTPYEAVEDVADDADYAADLEEEADEPVDVGSPSGARRGYVRTSTHRLGRVPYLLGDVIEARHELARADRTRFASRRSAREHGASWEDIGLAVGMTRQGAAKRFGSSAR